MPAVMLSTPGPGFVLGIRLTAPPGTPESSSTATNCKPVRLDPVNRASTVSKLLPIVSMKDVGWVTLNVHGAVHVHQALGPVPWSLRSKGSFSSVVYPTFDPLAVTTGTSVPLSGTRFTKSSFVRPLNSTGLPTTGAEAINVFTPTPKIQLPTVAIPLESVSWFGNVTVPLVVAVNVTGMPCIGLLLLSTTMTDGAGETGSPEAAPTTVVGEIANIPPPVTKPSRNAVMSSIMPALIEMPPMSWPAGELLKAADV